jgi:orotidine-5'-phosphate decarboxylase
MTYNDLVQQTRIKKSCLCVGLDTDIEKIPTHLLSEKDPVFEFNKQIIDATADFAVAYKPNTAFYEALGSKGWESLQKTIAYIPKNIFTIADAKRGDIGNTSGLYAKAFFEELNVDAVTVAPYMGSDSVKPFLKYKNKWVILLALTSNEGAEDFQLKEFEGRPLYKQVLETAVTWGTEQNLMFVTGATKADYLSEIREIVPNHFLLVPGVGAQGGDMASVFKYGKNSNGGLLINSSRNIIYASNAADFNLKARGVAKSMQEEMAQYF